MVLLLLEQDGLSFLVAMVQHNKILADRVLGSQIPNTHNLTSRVVNRSNSVYKVILSSQAITDFLKQNVFRKCGGLEQIK